MCRPNNAAMKPHIINDARVESIDRNLQHKFVNVCILVNRCMYVVFVGVCCAGDSIYIDGIDGTLNMCFSAIVQFRMGTCFESFD